MASALLALSTPLRAANLFWDGGDANGTNGANGGSGTWDLNTTANFYPGTGTTDQVWTDSTGTADIANFGGTAGTATLASALGALGLVFTTPGYTIGGTTALTIGSSGIDASALTSGTTTFNNPITLLANRLQNWSVGAGSTLQVNGIVTQGAFATLNFNIGSGGVINIASGTASTGIIYTTLNSSDFAALDATKNVVSLNSVAPYVANPLNATPSQSSTTSVVDVVNQNGTGASTAFRLGSSAVTLGGVRFNATSTSDWTVDFTGATNNRVLNIVNTPGILVGTGVNHNVIFQNAGTSGIRSGGGTNYFRNFSNFDLVINVPITQSGSGGALSTVYGGTGRIIIAADGSNDSGTKSIDGATLQIGNGGTTGTLGAGTVQNNGALQFNRTDAITFSNIVNGTGQVTQNGTGTVTLAGSSAFTGNINVNAGTLAANLQSNTTNPTSTALGNPQAVRNINVNTGSTLRFDNGDVMGGAASNINTTLVINGGTVTNNGTSFNTLGSVVLNNGTLTGTGGANNTQFQMYQLRSTVTVGGTAASTISGSGTTTGGSAAATVGYHLNGAITFNVANATSSPATDLDASAAFIDGTGATPVAGGITKTGVGTMTLSGVNTYTGGTIVNLGELAVSGASAKLGAGNVTVNAAAGPADSHLTIRTGVADAISDTATLTLAGGGVAGTADTGFVLLEPGVNETVGGLVLNGVPQAPGTYGSSTSGATNNAGFNDYFMGTGTLTVVPEPSTWAMMLGGAGLMALRIRLRNKRQRAA